MSELSADSQASNVNRKLMDELYNELWFMEIYGIIIRTIIVTLQAIVHVYLLLFGLVLIAYLIARSLFENWAKKLFFVIFGL